MKKNYNPLSLLVTVFFLLTFTNSCQQSNAMIGLWEGIFMEQYKIEIEFRNIENHNLYGILRMFDGEQQIQNDKLSKIKTNRDQFSFYIEAKQTTFIGVIEGDIIKGNFIFPDGSKHKLLVTKLKVESSANKVSAIKKTYSTEQLKSDLVFTKEKLETLHPNLYSFQDQLTFNQQFDKPNDQLRNDQDVVSFYTIVAPITNSVGCSHTGVRLPEEISDELEKSGNYFPVKLFFKDDQAWFIKSDLKDLPVEAGDELLFINNISIKDIKNQIFSFIPSEGNNISTKYFEINNAYDEYYVLIDNNTSFLTTFRKSSGGIVSVVLESCTYEKSKELYPAKKMYPEELFPVKFDINQSEQIAKLMIPTFGIRDIGYYNRFMDSIFILLDETGIQDLIIDLRGNSGGHPLFAAQLFSYLANESFVYFDSTSHIEEFAPLYTSLSPNPIHFSGRCYVLVDGGCLSTSGHLVSLLKYHGLAKIIGEEPGSSYICNDKSVQFTLPNTGIGLNVPTTVFQTAIVGYTRNTSMLDYKIETNLSDVINNNDPVLEKTDELIHQRRLDL